MKKTFLTLLIFALGISFSIAQSGEIKGIIFDELEKLPIPGAHVYIEIAGEKQGDVTTVDGRFTIKPLTAGIYNVYATFAGFKTELITGVIVKPDKITFMKNVYLSEGVILEGDIIIRAFEDKLIDIEEPSKISMLPAQLDKMPNKRNMPMVLRALSTEIQVSDNGKEIYFRGARSGSSVYFIDGIKCENMETSIPSGMVGSVTVYTGGVPAKYGDLTGGCIVIESL